ncbi:MAG: hypothetical protein JNM72_26490 [Deltaproteobacteria bacterium]|nr:hypothetical protein [Deltaproteobacteria bacterium]
MRGGRLDYGAPSPEAPLLPAPLALAALLSLGISPALPPPAHLWADGEDLGGAIVEGTVLHAEFERATLRLRDGSALQVELLAAERVGGPACAAHGLALSPRWELRGQSIEVEDQPPYIQALCARLVERGPRPRPLALAPPPPPAGQPPPTPSAQPVAQTVGPPSPPRAPTPPWLGASALLAALGLAIGGPHLLRGRLPSALVALAFGLLMAILAPGGMLVGPDGGAIPLVHAVEGPTGDPLYGPGWPAFAHLLTGGDPRLVFALNRGLAALAPALVALSLGALAPGLGRVALMFAGAAAALSPALLRLAGTEVPHLLLLDVHLLALAALAGAVSPATPRTAAWGLALTGAALCALAPGLRPEGLLVVILPLVALSLSPAGRRPWLLPPLLLGPALAVPRLIELLGAGAGSGVAQPTAALAAAGDLIGLLIGTRSGPLLLPLAVLGAVGARGGAGAASARLALAALVLSLAPVLHKAWPEADLLRLQLPSVGAALCLAGLGAAALPTFVAQLRLPPGLAAALSGGPRGARGLLALALSGALLLPRALGPWAPRAEWAALTAAVEGLPPGAVLLIAGDSPHANRQAIVLAAIGAKVHPTAEGEPPPLRVEAAERVRSAPSAAHDAPLYLWEGLRCGVGYPAVPGRTLHDPNPCAIARSACQVEVVTEVLTPPVGDLDLDWPRDPVPLRLLRLRGCQPGPAWAPERP